jgi:drug/metabolite transporter (DMT)-like permease
MLWLPIAICAYLLFSVVFLIDKHILAGPIGNPRVLIFYVGMLGLSGVLLIPFGLVNFPGIMILALALSAGLIRILATYLYFYALDHCEVSRVTTAIGATQPIFSFWLAWMLSAGQATLGVWELAAFVLLLAGSVVIVAEKSFFTFTTVRLSLTTSFLFSLSFILSKLTYDAQPFVSAFALMGFGSFGGALFFLCFADVRKTLLHLSFSAKAREKSSKSTILFFTNQFFGAAAFIMQNFAIALAPLAFVAVINALAGVQYAFLFILTLIISTYFPRVIKEKITPAIVLQKLAAIAFILSGLAILALK